MKYFEELREGLDFDRLRNSLPKLKFENKLIADRIVSQMI